jgi:hypothetical protein
MYSDRCGNNCRQKCHANGSRRENIMQQFMLNIKGIIIPVITGATGIVTEGLKKFEAIPIESLQKTAVLAISHIMRKVLQSEA